MSLGITSQDMRAVQVNWKNVSGDVVGLGCDAFQELFAVTPAYAGLFSGITDIGTLSAANSKMREHAMRVFSALGSWIQALSDAEVFDGLITLQGAQHKGRKISGEHFEAMRPALFAALQKRLGATFNRIAWDNVFTFIIAGLKKGGMQ